MADGMWNVMLVAVAIMAIVIAGTGESQQAMQVDQQIDEANAAFCQGLMPAEKCLVDLKILLRKRDDLRAALF